MQDYVERIVKALVDTPEDVHITESVSAQGEPTTYEVRVNPDDVGKVIGKQGRIANSLRTIVKSIAMKDKRKVYVEIIAT